MIIFIRSDQLKLAFWNKFYYSYSLHLSTRVDQRVFVTSIARDPLLLEEGILFPQYSKLLLVSMSSLYNNISICVISYK